MEVDSVFRYSELSGEDAIRLIHLQPSSELESGIQCSLKDTTLTEYQHNIADHYVAVSYVWGDANDKRSITVEGKRLSITASLDSALRHIRDPRRVLRIWADGVCINQTDVRDRNRQVRLMGDIYSTAQHTIIFLGLSSPKFDSILRLMGSEVQPSSQSTKSSGSGTASKKLSAGKFEAIVEDEILARPWFTRVWILQELVLSKDPWLQCGTSRIRWDVVCRSVLSSKSTSWKPDSRTVLTNMNKVRIKFRIANETLSEEPEAVQGESLLELLCMRRGCGLSDPRDMVYAHLGFASAQTRAIIPIDYDKTVAQVYEDATRLYMKSADVPLLLSWVEKLPLEERRGSHPSWVPDWSSPYRPLGSNRPYTPDTDENRRLTNYSSLPTSYADEDLPNVSWTVPHVLAFCGVDYGPIATIIPESSFPAYQRGNGLADSTPELILQWVSRSDDKFRRTRQVLVDYSSEKNLSEFFSPSESYDWEQSGWAEVASIVSTWMPAPKSKIKSRFGSPAKEKMETENFVKICISNILTLAACYDRSRHVGVLEGGVLVQLPRLLSQMGDFLVNMDPQSRGVEWTIVRSCEALLSDRECDLIRKDLSYQAPVQNCRFVASIPHNWNFWNGLYSTGPGRRQYGERKIFALH